MILRDIDRLLIGYDRRYRLRLLAILLLSAVQTLLVVLRPLPIKVLVETPESGSWEETLRHWAGGGDGLVYVFAGLILAVEVLILGFRLTGEFRSTRLSERFIRRIRGDVAATLLRGRYAEVAQIGVGRVLASVSADVSVIQHLIKDVVVSATLAGFQLVLMLIVVYLLKPALFWILLIEMAVLSGMIAVYSNWRKHTFLMQMANQETFLGWISNIYLKNLDLRFSQARNLFLGRSISSARTLFGTGLKLWMLNSVYSGFVEFFLGISSAACLIYLVLEAHHSGQPLGNLLVFLYYTMMVFPCLSKVGESVPMMTDARNAYDRLSPLLSLKSRMKRRPEDSKKPGFGRIEFRDIGLQSEHGEWILRGISFIVEPGDHVALFGDSGTGKSTLLGMLLGLIQPTEGAVLIDGVPVATMGLADRKRLILFQRSGAAFFNGTVSDNVTLGRPTAPEALHTTIAASRLTTRLAASEHGLQTTMSDRGEPFSQGEQQRIAIARVFLTDRPYILMDEALNSLDETSELAIVEALHQQLAGRTLIMISHRRSVAEKLPLLHALRRQDGQTIFEPAQARR